MVQGSTALCAVWKKEVEMKVVIDSGELLQQATVLSKHLPVVLAGFMSAWHKLEPSEKNHPP